MATAAPKAIKAFLEQVKTALLDEESSDCRAYYHALISLEILQRGVICPSDDKLWDTVTHVAGRALLETGLPPPLLAGSAVIAGRLAEQVAKRIVEADMEVPSAPIERCRQVQESRLLALLQPRRQREDFLYMAEGYYYRAASFQPDTPPMWKKAWDVVLEREGGHSWKSVVALQNMHRIAMAKQNTKRAAELQLNLAECALDAADKSSSQQPGSSIEQVFVAPYRPIHPYDGVRAAR